MKKKHKLIGVILCDMEEDYQSNVVSGIMAEAYRRDYNIAVFSSFIKSKASCVEAEIGESDIFHLINTDKLDAVIIMPYTIEVPETKIYITNKLRQCRCPVICIDEELDDRFYNVNTDEFSSIKNITEHLIKQHGVTKINFLSGPKGYSTSETRLNGYRTALEDNGIPFDESRIGYGNYWTVMAEQYAQNLVDTNNLPEAIVCANDSMAIAVCDCLLRNGIRVPDNILVTGYDGIDEGKIHVPQISTVNPSLVELGNEAVATVDKLIKGVKCSKHIYVKGKIVPSQSCGCRILKSSVAITEAKAYDNVYSMNQFFKGANDMLEDLFRSTDIESMRDNLYSQVYLVDGMNDFYMFLCENWDLLYDKAEIHSHQRGYHENMISCVAMHDHAFLEGSLLIKSEEMLPQMFEESENPLVFFFTPLNFRDQCFGYTAISFGDTMKVIDVRYRYWIKNICNTLEHIRSQEHLKWAMARLDKISIIDTLTGVFNRRGYERYVYDYLDSCKEKKEQLLVILGDLDCLKAINDLYGHGEGDSAIRVIAKAFQNCFTNDEICARIGGDEFIVVGRGEFTPEKINEYRENIENYLIRYNNTSGKPYTVRTSLGFYCDIPNEKDSLESIVAKADALMYENKSKHKKDMK